MNEIKLMFVGDIMLGELLENINRGVKSTIKQNIDPFHYVKEILSTSDLTIGNLECVLSDSSNLSKPFSLLLRADPQTAKLLWENNVKLVNLANNHTKDHGEAAFQSTINALSKHNIQYFGRSIEYDFQTTPHIKKIKDTKIGFLGYNLSNMRNDQLNSEKEKIMEIIKKSKKQVDILVLSLHWSLEHVNIPCLPYTSFAKEFLNAGVDIIYGHHSHQLQGVILENNKCIAFSLGNFIFDDLGKKTRYTGILEIKIDSVKKKITSQKLHPAYINKKYQPIPSHNEKEKLHYIEKLNHTAYSSYHASENDAQTITNKALKISHRGHVRNKIRIRLRILSHFWTYYRYMRSLINYKETKN